MNSTFLETIKIVDGEILNIEYHQKRYATVLQALGSTEIQNIKEFIKPPKWGLYRCRLVYDEDNIEVSFHEYK